LEQIRHCLLVLAGLAVVAGQLDGDLGAVVPVKVLENSGDRTVEKATLAGAQFRVQVLLEEGVAELEPGQHLASHLYVPALAYQPVAPGDLLGQVAQHRPLGLFLDARHDLADEVEPSALATCRS
jgi:hypothetical protein